MVFALAGIDAAQTLSDCVNQTSIAWWAERADDAFDLGPGLFDGVQIGGVGR